MKSLKIAVCIGWTILITSLVLFQDVQEIGGQAIEKNTSMTDDLLPNDRTIERFDNAVQRRFLTEPNFGMGRIVSGMKIPARPLESGHVRSFYPINEDEKTTLDEFQNQGWLVSIYLFGKTARPDGDEENPLEKFKIRYRLNKPVPVTPGLPEKKLTGSKKLISEVKEAFLLFQSAGRENDKNFVFAKDEWSFVARPVRAMNESCIKCHTDYVVTNKLDDGRFQFRKRAVGDVNGVIVYGFARSVHPTKSLALDRMYRRRVEFNPELSLILEPFRILAWLLPDTTAIIS